MDWVFHCCGEFSRFRQGLLIGSGKQAIIEQVSYYLFAVKSIAYQLCEPALIFQEKTGW